MSSRFLSFVFLALAASVSSAPINSQIGGHRGRPHPGQHGRPHGASMVMNNTAGQAGLSSGSVYFITNEPSGNMVVSADVGSDGSLVLARAVSAGGNGSHGINNGPDGLFSQASIKASQSAKMVATVNPGSNTAALFSIDAQNPSALTMVGQPVSSGGEFPMSVAFNEAGTKLCVLNGGAVNGVNCYKVDATAGLQAINGTTRSLGLNQTTPATGPAGTTSQLIFSQDEKSLIASVKGVPPTPGFLAVWDVADDDTLSADFTKLAPGTGGLLPFSMTLIPGKNALLATDAGVGFDIFDLSNVQAGGNSQDEVVASGESSVNPIDGQGATCWSSVSDTTGNFFVNDIETDMVTEINLDQNLNATIVKQYPQTPGSGIIDNTIAKVNGQDFFYVLGANATQIDVLAIKGPGDAQAMQTVDIAGPAAAAGLTVSPSNLQGMTAFIKQ